MAASILLVDDEFRLLPLLQRHLEKAGYEVLSCLTAELAWEAVRERPDWKPDCLVVDHGLPGVAGLDFAIDLMDRFPAMQCILTSGTPMELSVFPERLRSRAEVMHKPFLPDALTKSVAARLG